MVHPGDEKGSGGERLKLARGNRVARLRHSSQERYLHYLDLARRTRLDNGLDPTKLDGVLSQGRDELSSLAEAMGGRIEPRRRPTNKIERTFTLYIDECGSHSTSSKEKFPVFCLAGVLIEDPVSLKLDQRWKRWKRDYLGSGSKKVHEPDIRDRGGSFWCGGDAAKQTRAISRLDNILAELPYTAIVCVVHREEYLQLVEKGKSLDESLPQHIYLMAIDFIMERVALALDLHLGGGKTRVVVESRGPREDAALQYEFARLFLDGTTYVSDAFFRNQFYPGVEFLTKEDNSSGLQLADLVARPCGEKVTNPMTKPARWQAVQTKLCQGIETEHSILGLKVIPWNEKYVDLWKS